MKCKHWAMVKVKKNRIGDRMRHELSDCYRPSTGVCVCVCASRVWSSTWNGRVSGHASVEVVSLSVI